MAFLPTGLETTVYEWVDDDPAPDPSRVGETYRTVFRILESPHNVPGAECTQSDSGSFEACVMSIPGIGVVIRFIVFDAGGSPDEQEVLFAVLKDLITGKLYVDPEADFYA